MSAWDWEPTEEERRRMREQLNKHFDEETERIVARMKDHMTPFYMKPEHQTDTLKERLDT